MRFAVAYYWRMTETWLNRNHPPGICSFTLNSACLIPPFLVVTTKEARTINQRVLSRRLRLHRCSQGPLSSIILITQLFHQLWLVWKGSRSRWAKWFVSSRGVSCLVSRHYAILTPDESFRFSLSLIIILAVQAQTWRLHLFRYARPRSTAEAERRRCVCNSYWAMRGS